MYRGQGDRRDMMEHLYRKLKEYANTGYYPFHMPGHKRNTALIGSELPYELDITEIDGFDDLHHSEGILKELQEYAACVYHAEETHYLVNGSTVGLLSAVMGSTNSGDCILMARNCHKSVYNAVFMNQLHPIYIYPENGAIIKPNAFDNSYIAKGDDMSENSQNKIEVTQPAIPHESYLATYITALDLCLQGIISPSTLGIDVKKLDNAEAQREKEKTTLYTRGNIVDILQDQIPSFIQKVFDVINISQNKTLTEVKCTIDFSEYANPSFESQVETVGKAKTQGIMSVEASVEELYGDTKDEEWKKEEVARLKAEQGITDEQQPALNMEGDLTDEGNSREKSIPNVQEQGNEPS